jgi:hypothetical protein
MAPQSVSAHHGRDAPVLHGGLERPQVQLAERPLVHARVEREAVVLARVDRVVLGVREHRERLDALDHRGGHPGDEERILAEPLERPAGERIAREVEGRAEEHVVPRRERLSPEHLALRARERRVPRGRDGERRRELRGAPAVHAAVGDADAGGPVGHRERRDPEAIDRRVVEAVDEARLPGGEIDLLLERHRAEEELRAALGRQRRVHPGHRGRRGRRRAKRRTRTLAGPRRRRRERERERDGERRRTRGLHRLRKDGEPGAARPRRALVGAAPGSRPPSGDGAGRAAAARIAWRRALRSFGATRRWPPAPRSGRLPSRRGGRDRRPPGRSTPRCRRGR